ncbi:MAG TPA: polysaccharide deacetylase family protein [Coriobacteriia bacterium]|nr:polysaccharide deacetylase family protein [Coriobacteriia bacterium]
MEPLETARTKFLLYHDLASLTGGDKGLARERFRTQLELMRRWGYSFRSMAEFLDGSAHTSRDIVITFDDGGSSLMDTALPVLEEFGAPATLFMIAGYAGLTGEGYPFLTWEELVESASRGIDIGSHTLSHQPLTTTDRDVIRAELDGAAKLFARHGFSPRTFAYPYGRRSDEAKDLVREAGFEAAFMIKKGGHDRYELRRRLFNLTESPALMRLFLSDHYFGVRGAIVSLIPGRFRRDVLPLPDHAVAGRAFGIDSWDPAMAEAVDESAKERE